MAKTRSPDKDWEDLRVLGYGLARMQWAYKVIQRIEETIKFNPTRGRAEVARPIAASIFQTDPKLWSYLSQKYGFK